MTSATPAFAAPELNTPILRIGLADSAICVVNNVGSKDLTIAVEVYGDEALVSSPPEEVLAPNETYSVGTSGHFRWQCKIKVLKGSKKSVRGAYYGVGAAAQIPANVVEAR
jgi:hypothetical protein